VAAGILAIASLGILQYQKRSDNLASKSATRTEVAANDTKQQPLAPPAFSSPATKSDKIQDLPSSASTDLVVVPAPAPSARKKNTRSDALRESAPPPSASSGPLAVGGQFPHGPKLANQWQQNTPQNQLSDAQASPFAKQQAAGDLTANMQVPAVSETVGLDAQSAQLKAAQTPTDDYALERVGKAKPAAPTNHVETAASAVQRGEASPPQTPAPAQAAGGPVSTNSALVPRWSIDPAGRLQRSFDQGSTWQEVNVNPNPASSESATSLQVSANPTRAERRAEKAEKKDAQQALKRQPLSPTFRSVAATGTDIWAGGSGGVLYHSSDAGDHWFRVAPVSSGAMLTGDIVSLEFADPQHGKILTSTGEIWTTSDDGQTWQKQ
jgi:hypothetical protein